MIIEIQKIRDSFNEKMTRRKITQENLTKSELNSKDLKEHLENIEKARIIIQEVAQKTQQNLEYHISHVVNLALNTVYDSPPEFIIKFETRRNKTECDLLFKENNVEQKPIDCSGGGLLDITSFALRIAFWTLNKTRNVMILDEPFKFLSPDLHEKAGQMIKMVSQKLNIQFIIVSHSETVNLNADKTFMVSKKDGHSQIKETQTL